MTQTFVFDGVRTEAPYAFILPSPEGGIAWRVEATTNASLVRASFEGEAMGGRSPRFLSVMVLPSGSVEMPPELQEREPMEDDGVDVAVGPQSAAIVSPARSAHRVSGAGSVFTDESSALLVFAWSGIEPGSILELRWLEGSRATAIELSHARGFSAADMSGTRSHVRTMGIDVDREIDFAVDGLLLGVVEVNAADVQGSLSVSDENGQRALDLVDGSTGTLRTFFSARGDTTVRLASDRSAVVHGLVLQPPAGLLPDDLWWTQPGSPIR